MKIQTLFAGIVLIFLTISWQTNGRGFEPISALKIGFMSLLKSSDPGDVACGDAISQIFNDDAQQSILIQMLVSSGKAINDLGNFEQCTKQELLQYALVTIKSESQVRQLIQMGLCIPKQCNATQLRMFDKIFRQGMLLNNAIQNPSTPEYTFPLNDYETMWASKGFGFYFMILVFIAFFGLSIFGYLIEKKSIGDKKQQSSMVEAIEEEHPERISIEARKEKWALIIYSFSITRNFSEIFFRPYKSIKDKKFEVFHGLKFQMMTWVILGHCYLLASQFGNASTYLKQQALNQFFCQIIISSDFPISFFYFMSAFINMYSLIKKYQKTNEETPSCQGQGPNQTFNSQNDCEFSSVPKLNITSMLKQILVRWTRLAFPTLIIILFSATIFPYLGTGPAFTYINTKDLQEPLEKYWWSLFLFIQNFTPWYNEPGLYWLYFIANDFQFYVLVMLPCIYYYQKKNNRWFVIGFLSVLILESIIYLMIVTANNNFTTILVIDNNNMFNEIFRRPFAPVGYYAFGILLSIFYFEYTQAISNRELRKRNAFRFMQSVGRTKRRSLITQICGGLLLVFVIFIRYSSFGFNDDAYKVAYGRWPTGLNSLFNGVSHYLFIMGFVLLFLPIFIGKLSIIRDIYASTFFRPLSRINFSAGLIQGLCLFLIFFSQEQHVYFDHKNVLFIYFALVLNVYIISFFVALFLEYPFRTMGKVIFSPPKKILRLKTDLAKELNTNIDNIFNDSEDDDSVKGEHRDTPDIKNTSNSANFPSNHSSGQFKFSDPDPDKRLSKIQEINEEEDKDYYKFQRKKLD